MNILKTICLVAIGMIAMSSGCEKSETISPNPNQCYEGVVIAKDCPSLLFVQVIDMPIGETWELNHNYDFYPKETFSNAISINNIHQFSDYQNLQIGEKVFFTINVSENPSNCIKIAPCTTDIRFASYPTKQYCIKSISTLKCPENNEN